MKKIFLLTLGLFLALHLSSCKKSELKNSAVNNNAQTETRKETIDLNSSANESGQKPIDFDWTKMNYNMLSSLVFDIQINPEKYQNKRVKVAGNYHTSMYKGKRYNSVLIWDPTGCCPAGLDFIPPADMTSSEDFPEPDEKITVTGILNYSENAEIIYLTFQAEEVIRENK